MSNRSLSIGDKMLAHTGDVVMTIMNVFRGTTASFAICTYLKAKSYTNWTYKRCRWRLKLSSKRT
jgi:hypothetical protein